MKFIKVMLLAATMLFLSSTATAGEGGYIGEVSIFAGNFAPREHAFCEGQLLPISSNTALFSILGTMYGGDGRTTFALPNLKEAEKVLNGPKYIIRLSGIFPSRS